MRAAMVRQIASLVVVILVTNCSSPAAPSRPVNSPPAATVAAQPSPTQLAPIVGIGDPYFPQLGNLGYDALHYTLELNVDMSNLQRTPISATVTMQARATEALPTFSLDFRRFTIEAVSVNQQPAIYQQAGRKLLVQPSMPLQDDELFTTTVSYSGTPAGDGAGGDTRRGWNRFDGGIYTFGVPDGASTWYPVNDHLRDKASYTFRITVPKPYVVAANGLLVDTGDDGTTTTFHWESRDPIASYLVALVIAEQVEETQAGPNGLALRNYFPPDFPAERKAIFAQTQEMIAFLSERFGPYPFEAYGAVVVDTEFASFDAMEHQTLSMYANSDLALRETVVLHELAHQWFGNSVSLSAWNEGWLKEGFATYAEWLWEAHTAAADGENVLRARVRKVYETPKQPWESYPPLLSPDSDFLLNPSVYTRGALTLHALRVRVGDETFWRIVRSYAERYRHGNASTDDFIALAEEISGQQLDDFFDAWLRQREIPPITELGLS
jgi:aminopeptidase N